jgi:glycosyltransferase involved in cell wall biosynthesis
MIDPNQPDYTDTPGSTSRSVYGYAPADINAAPFVTIVTPFYNVDTIFHETACSVFRQSMQQWEWVIINDGSTDAASLSILDFFRYTDPRIRVIDHPTNQGLSAARNTGFRAARAEFVVQLDSDDLIEPTAIEKWCWFLESHPEYSFAKGYTVQFGPGACLWQKGFHHGSEFLRKNLVNPTAVIRKAVHQAVGGYDETDRGGLMDWDFWLRCANHGYWGGSVPEFLDWYRRRPAHTDLWPDFDEGERQRAYGSRLRNKYERLWQGGFPEIQARQDAPTGNLPDELPCENRLLKSKPRLLMLIPWMSLGGADRFNLDLLNQLARRGWEVTVATTLAGDHSWLPHYARHTPDLFILHHLLDPRDYPRFLRYLIASRQIDTVLISHSELAYQLLPYLRAHFPGVTFVDYCHIAEEYWRNGGYPRMGIECQDLLDLNLVSSEHLKSWMVSRGADSERIGVSYTNVDIEEFRPDASQRISVRQELGLDLNVPVILYSARICGQKQPDVFARTILQLHERGLEFLALVAGSGPDLQWLGSFVARNALHDRVRLLGEVRPARVRPLMQASDVFFLPSSSEGIALTIYEAMACGLAVVGADTGGQRELVTPETGILLSRSDKETEAKRYAEILAHLLSSPACRRDLGRAARDRVARLFPLERMGERVTSLLEQATEWHGSRPRSVPTLDWGITSARQAVECIRLSQATAQVSVAPRNNGWRERSYLILARLYDPWYRLGVRRGWKRVPALAERVKKALLRG